MYYNNYNGNRYNGYGYQQPVHQPIYRQEISIQEMPIQATRFMNEAEARAYIVMPNQKEMLIDREKGVAYLKFADSMGQSSCRRFKFEEIFEDKAQPINTDNKNLYLTKEESKEFVSRKDFDRLVAKVNAIRLAPKSDADVGEKVEADEVVNE